MIHYHAHIYFKPSDDFQSLHSLIASSAEGYRFQYVKPFRECVGPHPLPMIEVGFEGSTLESVKQWCETKLPAFSILIHEDTGNDQEDHANAIWIGQKLDLDFSFFDKIKITPSLMVHPQ